jgi:hypothetical protein
MNQETPQTAPANPSTVMAMAVMAVKTIVIGLEECMSYYHTLSGRAV